MNGGVGGAGSGGWEGANFGEAPKQERTAGARANGSALPRVFPFPTHTQAGPPDPRPLPPRDPIWGGGGLSDGYTRAEVREIGRGGEEEGAEGKGRRSAQR